MLALVPLWCLADASWAVSDCCKAGRGCEAPRHIVPTRIPDTLCWVAYSPTHMDPDRQVFPNAQSLREDLRTLRKAGFDGLVTYSAKGILGDKLPKIAEQAGFDGLILGVWDPRDTEEIGHAKAAAKSAILRGYVLGNEGMHPKEGAPRYDKCELRESMNALRRMTGIPVTTSEDSAAYASDPDLRDLGDWIFPNAHPYWQGATEPRQAVAWTRGFFAKQPNRGRRPVFLREVGLPSQGMGSAAPSSEDAQASYYAELGRPGLPAGLHVDFVYFEAFDQTWKQGPVERSWGLFRDDRSPKKAAGVVCGRAPQLNPDAVQQREGQTPTPAPAARTISKLPPAGASAFFVYQDGGSPDNGFAPSGPMGDWRDLQIDEGYREHPQGETGTSMQVVYKPTNAQGDCPYAGPCKWAGLRWQAPPGNLGQDPTGWDLRAFRKLVFRARGDTPTQVRFLVGGIGGQYPDSIVLPIERTLTLTQDWLEYSLDLSGADLSHVIGGFGFAIDWPGNRLRIGGQDSFTIYLDDIRFEP